MNVEHAWSTPIMRTSIDDQTLIEQLLNLAIADPDSTKDDAAELTRAKLIEGVLTGDPVCVRLYEQLRAIVDQFFERAYNLRDVQYGLEPFYLVHGQGKHVKYHNHRGSSITGVLYVNVPGGPITLVDPRVNANRGMMEDVIDTGCFNPIEIMPKAGEVIVFPSYVYHVGAPNLSPLPRVVVPFDVGPTYID